MATTTPNFGWTVPTSTDLVKDGATAIETLGDGIDASFVGLKGGTTGQVLSKTSATDLAFTWVTDPGGDITGVTAGTGISGGGTSGTVTVTNSMATAITTAGDTLYGTGAGTFSRLGIGSTGNVLTVAGGVPSWAAPAGGGKILQVVQGTTTTATTIATTTMTDTGITATITPTSATSKILVMISAQFDATRSTGNIAVGAKVLRGATTIQDFGTYGFAQINATGSSATGITIIKSQSYLDSPATTSATTYKLQAAPNTTANSASAVFQIGSFPSSIILMEVGA